MLKYLIKLEKNHQYYQYLDFANYLLFNLKLGILLDIYIYNYNIYLENIQLLSYNSIYNLKIIKLETLKNYIKTNLANKFIMLFKLFIKNSI